MALFKESEGEIGIEELLATEIWSRLGVMNGKKAKQGRWHV